ncbi:hypothetical protein Q5M87_06925 [Brachyspira innocens]|uniref:Uncharacterized protein n=1 Tax=Brachyspira innocens TaxID=13264 RepID=A0ABT8YXL5_9SPIR|nr:hypothetical protein [Brachyspira innocens]MDO6993742.1 hypothetical protein [Brachyspira innocens]MDO7020604.1 hypothetical protein [Brachyspira innocens]
MEKQNIWEVYENMPHSWQGYFHNICDFEHNMDLLERLRAGLPEDMSNVLPELKTIAEKSHSEGRLWDFDSLYCVRPLHLSEEEYVFTKSGRIHKLISAYENMLELKDVLSGKIWIWEDINRTFLPYGDTSRLERGR